MRIRFFVAFALVIVVALASVLLIFRQGAVLEVGRYMTRAAMGVDELATELEQYYQLSGNWNGVQEVLSAGQGPGHGMGMMGGRHLRIADVGGNIVADNQRDPQGKLTAAERGAAVALRDTRGRTVGYLLAEMGQGMMNSVRPNEQLLLDRLLRAGLIAGSVSGGLALLLAFVLAYGLIQPVEELTSAATKMAAGDLSQRVRVSRSDEVGTLGRVFNQMAASLHRAEQNRRAMTADIAHELRTPIAIQRAHLEALQDGVYPLTVENLQPILEQTGLLARLVDDLRTLALADAGELRLERAATDLDVLVRRVIDRFRPEADARQVEWIVEKAPDLHLQALNLDSGRIEQILNNLFSNALRYTPAGGRVTARLRKAGDAVELSVEDTGPGILPDDLPRVFERFYRADRSRSREQGGTGLGLAIARQLALAHGGDLSAANRPEGGAVFTLRLPR